MASGAPAPARPGSCGRSRRAGSTGARKRSVTGIVPLRPDPLDVGAGRLAADPGDLLGEGAIIDRHRLDCHAVGGEERANRLGRNGSTSCRPRSSPPETRRRLARGERPAQRGRPGRGPSRRDWRGRRRWCRSGRRASRPAASLDVVARDEGGVAPPSARMSSQVTWFGENSTCRASGVRPRSGPEPAHQPAQPRNRRGQGERPAQLPAR